MPRLDFICISLLYSSLACICMINSSGSIWDKINSAHSISLTLYMYLYTYTYIHTHNPLLPLPIWIGFHLILGTGKK